MPIWETNCNQIDSLVYSEVPNKLCAQGVLVAENIDTLHAHKSCEAWNIKLGTSTKVHSLSFSRTINKYKYGLFVQGYCTIQLSSTNGKAIAKWYYYFDTN